MNDVNEFLYDVSQISAFVKLINGLAKKRNESGDLVFTIPKSVADTDSFKNLCYEAGHNMNQYPEIEKMVKLKLLEWQKLEIEAEMEKLK
jgi:hypothetical protein